LQVKTFKSNMVPAAVFSVPILEEGRDCLAAMNMVSLLNNPCSNTDVLLLCSAS